jgi:hypothetical protein
MSMKQIWQLVRIHSHCADKSAPNPCMSYFMLIPKLLTDILTAKPKEIRSFLSGQLPPERTQELHDQLLAAGFTTYKE